MFGRDRRLSASTVSDKLAEAADFIRQAAVLLDEACNHAPATLVARIEAVPGQSAVERVLADHLDALAAEIAAEDALNLLHEGA
jgi:hypothetical protein